jgi:putative tricarboxylic transport membrane protein
MNKYDRISSLFWVALGCVICVESIRLGPGSLSAPEPGLIPLGCGLLLCILGLSEFFLTFRRGRHDEESQSIWGKGNIGKVIFTLVSLGGYALLINPLGFHLTTFIWMLLICRLLSEISWISAILTSLIATSSSMILFEYLLGIRFPRGVLF